MVFARVSNQRVNTGTVVRPQVPALASTRSCQYGLLIKLPSPALLFPTLQCVLDLNYHTLALPRPPNKYCNLGQNLEDLRIKRGAYDPLIDILMASRGSMRRSYSQLESNDAIVSRLAQQDKIPWYKKPNLRLLYLLMFPTCLGVQMTSGQVSLGTSLMAHC